jgi:hypothetical protein
VRVGSLHRQTIAARAMPVAPDARSAGDAPAAADGACARAGAWAGNAMLGWGHGMQRVNAREHHAFFGNFRAFAREQLPHFGRWPHRHLFLFPLDSMFAPRWLLPSMVAHTGSGYTTPGLDVTVPYLVSLPPAPDSALLLPRKRLVFLMASPSRNAVRRELAAQLRVATAHMRSQRTAPQVELYETE